MNESNSRRVFLLFGQFSPENNLRRIAGILLVTDLKDAEISIWGALRKNRGRGGGNIY